MPEIIPIRDLKNTNAISQRCHETQEPIFVTKRRLWGYGYHEHKGSSDVVRGVFIYIVSCIFLGTLLIISTIITTAEFRICGIALKQNGCLPPHSEKHP